MWEKKGKEYKESLSKAGKESAIQAFLRLSGFKIMSPDKQIKKGKRNLFLDDLTHLNDNLVIVKVYETSMDENMKKQIINEKLKTIPVQKTKIKKKFFYNINLPKKDNYDGPSCTKYTPKLGLIYPKIIIGPYWNTISGRKYKKIEPDEKDFLITHDSIIDNEKKSSVNMNKDTQRGNYLDIRDVRIRTDKKFDYKLNFKIRKGIVEMIKKKQNQTEKDKNKTKNKNSDNELNLSLSNSNIFKDKIPKKRNVNSKNCNKTVEKNNNNNDEINTIPQKESSKKSSPNKLLQSKDNNNISKSETKKKENKKINPKNNIKTIDFNKTLSREKREQVLSKKKLVDIMRNPDHSPIYERTKIFRYHTIQSQNVKKNKKYNSHYSYNNYDPNKAFKIRVVHPLDKVPNFNLFLPRPKENKILPSFMQKMFNRNNVYTLNDKGLKLNEYSTQKFGKTITSFFPKKSFNNIINMNIMTGNVFNDDYKNEDINFKKEEIKQRMKIKNRNLGKLIKEGELKRFDNLYILSKFKSFSKCLSLFGSI